MVCWTYKLLTFYRFVDIPDPYEEVIRHKQFCRDIGMKGRIYIGEEGISATCTVNPGQYFAYRLYLSSRPYFRDIPDIESKRSDVSSHQFDKMIVKYRKEIVALGRKVSASQVKKSLQEVSPDQLKNILDQEKWDEYAILDMRNSYEYKLGHFKNAIPAGTINFREVKKFFQTYRELFAGKKVIMYCTGGIRCEKLSVLLKEEGFDNFFALNGGVIKYINQYNDGNWLGNLYTFDGVISKRVGDVKTHTKIGRCIYSGLSTDNIENCRYSPCNARIICRRKQYKLHGGFCSKECFDKAKKDLLVKNDARDKCDYQAIRDAVKQGKMTYNEACERVSTSLDRIVKKKVFVHQTSQKEEIVDRQFLDDYMRTIKKTS